MAIAKTDLAAARRVCAEHPLHDIESTSYLLDPGLKSLAGRSAFCYICGGAFLVESWPTIDT